MNNQDNDVLMNKQSNSNNSLDHETIEQLRNIVNEQGQVLSADATEFFATDVYRQLALPLAVVRPASVEVLQAVIKFCNAKQIAVNTRGGGASYTDGYLPNQPGSISVDLGLLNCIETVDESNGYVTVESGVSWSQLKETLDPLGLRTPFWGPFSGLHATIGGSISQNTVSHGSGAHGISAQSVISMDVILADGSLIQTGSAAIAGKPFTRFFGPDLTGLFTGDCGALGIKARVTLPLLKKKPAHQTISFAFNHFKDMHESMRLISMEQLEDTHFALDGALSQGQIAKQDSPKQLFSMAWSMFKSSPSYVIGLKQLIQSAVSAKKLISQSPYMTHYIVEGASQAEAKAKLHRLRQINLTLAQEIPATVPAIVRSMPFAPFFNTLGPAGERWVPMHGILPHSAVTEFDNSLQAYFSDHKNDMERLGIWQGAMFSAIGSSAFLYEVALYWPDEISCYHQEMIPKEYLAGLPSYPANPEARQYVEQIKQDIIALYCKHGAVNFQLGKMYPYASRLEPNTLGLSQAIKQYLDPKQLIAPGNLGL